MNNDAFTAAIGTRLRVARDAVGLTQADVALRAGLTQGFISSLEAGNCGASVQTLSRLAATVGVSLAVLLGDSPAPPKVDAERSAAG